jgi:putative hemolysin
MHIFRIARNSQRRLFWTLIGNFAPGDNMHKPEKKFIDLAEIIREKNPKLHKVLPRFVLNYIRRVIHEEKVNDFIVRHGDKHDFDFVHEVLNEFQVRIKVEGGVHIPSSGGCIFASNHPLGGLDAMALLEVISKKRTDLKFIVNDILLQLKNLQGLFVGVNKHGKTSAQMLEEIDALYGSQKGVLIFPAGLVSRKQGGKIMDLEWKKSFITQAKKHERSIIPVYVDAKNSNWFYNLSLWRKRMGVGANIEMFYLVDEMYHQRGKTITLIFGKPLPPSLFDRSRTDKAWAQAVKEHVYALGSGDNSKLIANSSH